VTSPDTSSVVIDHARRSDSDRPRRSRRRPNQVTSPDTSSAIIDHACRSDSDRPRQPRRRPNRVASPDTSSVIIDHAHGSDSDRSKQLRRPPNRVTSPDTSSAIELSRDEDQDDQLRHNSPMWHARAMTAASYNEGGSHASSSSGPSFRGRKGRIFVVSSDAEPSTGSDREEGHSSRMARRSGHLEEDQDGDSSEIDSDSVDHTAARERELYGEDDSISGPPAHLRHLFQESDESCADEDQAVGADKYSDSFGESWHGHDGSSVSGDGCMSEEGY